MCPAIGLAQDSFDRLGTRAEAGPEPSELDQSRGPQVGQPYPREWLPNLFSGEWVGEESFHGRPTVYLHVTSWSPTVQRLLPLWQQRLALAQKHAPWRLVLIVHDQHVDLARRFCRGFGFDTDVFHDPLYSTAPPELPWAVVVDPQGLVVESRLPINRPVDQWLQQRRKADAPAAAASAKAWDRESRPPLSERIYTTDQESIIRAITVLQESDTTLNQEGRRAAEHLLRFSYFTSDPEVLEWLTLVRRHYRQAYHQRPRWDVAFALHCASRLSFDRSGGQDFTALRESLEMLHNAATTPGADARHRLSQDVYRHYGPRWILAARAGDAPYDWLERPEFQPSKHLAPLEPGTSETEQPNPRLPWSTFLLACETAPFEPDRPATVPFREPDPRTTVTPVPPASVQIDSLWVPALGKETRQARLILRLKFKRGQWQLDENPRLHWRLTTAAESEVAPSSPSHSAFWVYTPSPFGSDEDPSRRLKSLTEEVWLETDVYFEEPLPDGPIEPIPPQNLPPARNAQLFFSGTDPATRRLEPRVCQFFLSPPAFLATTSEE